MRLNDVSDHLPHRESFALIALRVARLEPVETQIGVIGALLLREEDRKSFLLRELRPTRSVVVDCCILRASMQHDDKGRFGRQDGRQIKPALQHARVRTEVFQLDQLA